MCLLLFYCFNYTGEYLFGLMARARKNNAAL